MPFAKIVLKFISLNLFSYLENELDFEKEHSPYPQNRTPNQDFETLQVYRTAPYEKKLKEDPPRARLERGHNNQCSFPC